MLFKQVYHLSVGELYLVPYDSEIFRVLVLAVGSKVAICHFVDLGKCENVALNETLFIPAPGNSLWGTLINQVCLMR